MEMIRGLAQREYNEKIIMVLESMIKKIDELARCNIPYKYEYPLRLKDGKKDKSHFLLICV